MPRKPFPFRGTGKGQERNKQDVTSPRVVKNKREEGNFMLLTDRIKTLEDSFQKIQAEVQQNVWPELKKKKSKKSLVNLLQSVVRKETACNFVVIEQAKPTWKLTSKDKKVNIFARYHEGEKEFAIERISINLKRDYEACCYPLSGSLVIQEQKKP